MGLRVTSENRTMPVQDANKVAVTPRRSSLPADAMTSFAKGQNNDEKSWGEKVKAFFTMVWSWLAANVLCWCIKKESDEVLQRKEELHQKKETHKRFESLPDGSKTEWNSGLDKFKECQGKAFKGDMHPHLQDEIMLCSNLEALVKGKVDRKQIEGAINQASIPEKAKKELLECAAKTPKAFLSSLDERKKYLQTLLNNYEITPFAMFMTMPGVTKLQAEAVFRTLSLRGKERVLDIYRDANQNPSIKIEDFITIISVKPDIKFIQKMTDKIFDSIQKEFDLLTEPSSPKAERKE